MSFSLTQMLSTRNVCHISWVSAILLMLDLSGKLDGVTAHANTLTTIVLLFSAPCGLFVVTSQSAHMLPCLKSSFQYSGSWLQAKSAAQWIKKAFMIMCDMQSASVGKFPIIIVTEEWFHSLESSRPNTDSSMHMRLSVYVKTSTICITGNISMTIKWKNICGEIRSVHFSKIKLTTAYHFARNRYSNLSRLVLTW